MLTTVKSSRYKLTGTQEATELSKFVTVVTNTSGKTLSFGFLPPHGVRLADGESVTVDGDLQSYFFTSGGRQHKRKVTGFQNAVDNKLIRVIVSNKHIVYAAVDAGTTISEGDFVYLDTDDVKPAADFTWDTDLGTTQAAFVNSFLGVALADHVPADGAVTNFPVDISPVSIFTYPCTNETHEIGALMGLAQHATLNKLQNQKLEKVSTAARALARVVKRDSSASTTTVVRIQSAYWGQNVAGDQ